MGSFESDRVSLVDRTELEKTAYFRLSEQRKKALEQKIYDSMVKPAFIFDGRNILDHDKLREIGFVVYSLGKPLDPFLHGSYN